MRPPARRSSGALVAAFVIRPALRFGALLELLPQVGGLVGASFVLLGLLLGPPSALPLALLAPLLGDSELPGGRLLLHAFKGTRARGAARDAHGGQSGRADSPGSGSSDGGESGISGPFGSVPGTSGAPGSGRSGGAGSGTPGPPGGGSGAGGASGVSGAPGGAGMGWSGVTGPGTSALGGAGGGVKGIMVEGYPGGPRRKRADSGDRGRSLP